MSEHKIKMSHSGVCRLGQNGCISRHQAALDDGCITLPDGDCIGLDCMHSPTCEECGHSGMMHRAWHAQMAADIVCDFAYDHSYPGSGFAERLTDVLLTGGQHDESFDGGDAVYDVFLDVAHHARLALGMEKDR